MTDRIYIDCFAKVGRRGPKDTETPYETEVLIDEMEWSGIHGALIGHWVSKEYDPMFGNRKLMKELRKSPRLFGVWTVMPHHTGEIAKPKELVKEINNHGIRSVKMYPRTHHYPFNIDFCGELLAQLEESGILLMVEGGNMYNPDILEPSNEVLVSELDVVLTRYPSLTVVLQGARWDGTRYLYWLMSKHPKLFLEFSNHQGNRALEVYSSWFGSERLLFGSGALDKSPGAAKSFVDYCQLDEGEKKNIAGLNIAKLLRLESLPTPYRKEPARDSILKKGMEGKPLRDTLVIDAHAHIAHDNAVGTGFMHQPHSDAASMIERGSVFGLDKMCVSSWLGVWTDYEEGNEIVRSAMKRHPNFYVGYATLQPQYVKDWKRELKKVHKTYGMKGIKPYHPRTGIPYNDKLWTPWFEYGNQIRAFALIHPSPDVVREVKEIAERHPDLTFIMAHSGASFKDARLAIEIATDHPNVVLEITLTSVTYKVIEFMVSHVGADRVLFGTDQPMRDPIPQFGWVVYSRCSYEEKKKILGLNMQKIIRRVKV